MDREMLPGLREEYTYKELSLDDMSADPLKQFELWLEEHIEKDKKVVNAMTLATADKNGVPSARVVLLKGMDDKGFIFFTNYKSKKGNNLEENPYASLLFFWENPNRQIRIEGKVEKVSREESEAYFHSRPFDSQIAALASDQSSVIQNREEIILKFKELKEKFKDSGVPLPDNWGGYRLIPYEFEFWQGAENRLHERFRYTLDDDKWKIERLAP